MPSDHRYREVTKYVLHTPDTGWPIGVRRPQGLTVNTRKLATAILVETVGRHIERTNQPAGPWFTWLSRFLGGSTRETTPDGTTFEIKAKIELRERP